MLCYSIQSGLVILDERATWTQSRYRSGLAAVGQADNGTELNHNI